MSSIEKDFAFGPEATVVVEVSSVSLDRESEPSVERAFFKGEGVDNKLTIDLDRCLHCLSRNPTLKLEVIYSSSSSS